MVESVKQEKGVLLVEVWSLFTLDSSKSFTYDNSLYLSPRDFVSLVAQDSDSSSFALTANGEVFSLCPVTKSFFLSSSFEGSTCYNSTLSGIEAKVKSVLVSLRKSQIRLTSWRVFYNSITASETEA